MQMFMVGGAVRDELLGVPSKDIDFTVVLDEQDRWINDSAFYNDPFMCMDLQLERMGFEIFLRTPEFLTIRARFPKHSEHSRLTADFVLARKESDYTDGRRPDKVIPGTLEDDLARRDFTMNAIAKDSDGNLIDPFDGQTDIERRLIRAVGSPYERLTEDALRAVRALRFSVTKGFTIDPVLDTAMCDGEVMRALGKISDERIQAELSKMFRFDTVASIRAIKRYEVMMIVIFAGNVSLDATMKQRGRGK
jgi:tRNA nucleotidyltransferase/poly(A) polymerase